VLTSSDPVHTFESTEKLAAANLAQQLQTPHVHVQNSRFGACLRVVQKAEAAFTCQHTTLPYCLSENDFTLREEAGVTADLREGRPKPAK